MKPKNFPGRREARRKDAVERQARWAALSLDEQLNQLGKRPGSSKKQVKRLTQRLTIVEPTKEVTVEAAKKEKAPPKSDKRATKAFKAREK